MLIRILLLFVILAAGAVYSIAAGKLTVPAALTGVALALCVYGGGGFTGMAMMTSFFIVGSAATSWKFRWKQQQGLAESEKGKRKAMQVVANAGVAAIAGLLFFLTPKAEGCFVSAPGGMFAFIGRLSPSLGLPLLWVMMAAAFAAATADTLSSELGNIYGRKYYNILSLRRDQRGLNGVISLEGTLCGLAGSLLIGIIAAAGFGGGLPIVLIVALTGTIGNLTDSILGGTLERKGWIGNNTVNFLNTAVAALSVLLF